MPRNWLIQRRSESLHVFAGRLPAAGRNSAGRSLSPACSPVGLSGLFLSTQHHPLCRVFRQNQSFSCRKSSVVSVCVRFLSCCALKGTISLCLSVSSPFLSLPLPLRLFPLSFSLPPLPLSPPSPACAPPCCESGMEEQPGSQLASRRQAVRR